MIPGSCFGQGMGLLLPAFCSFVAGLEPEAVIAGFQDMAVVGKAIEQSRRHLGVAEYAGPFTEAGVGRDDDVVSFVKLCEREEQQGSAGSAEREITEFI